MIALQTDNSQKTGEHVRTCIRSLAKLENRVFVVKEIILTCFMYLIMMQPGRDFV